MAQYGGSHFSRAVRFSVTAMGSVAFAMLLGSCSRPETAEPSSARTAMLRIGIGQLSATSPLNGLRQLAQIVAVEGLARLTPEGRVEPWIAEKWAPSNNGRSLIVTLKSGVKFHDGSPVTAKDVGELLQAALPGVMGSTVKDVETIRPLDEKAIEITFRRPAPFLLESLEVQIKKAGQGIVATGPYIVTANSTTDWKANSDYYLGRPQIDDVQFQMFPSIRTAWAELLRNQLDMLYEVGYDALDSLEPSKNIALFTYVRHYQYLLALNNASAALKDKTVRRALNMAIDRQELVRQALRGHGVPSTGPLSSRYWALPPELPAFTSDMARAAETLRGKRVRFTCLLADEQANERMALELKRQFAAVGVEMELKAVTQDQVYEAEKNGAYDAILTEAISGPTAMRVYNLWHSTSPGNPGGRWGNATVDAALDRARTAEDENAYRQAVAGLQQAFIDDPAAVFLAWSERARAINKRFVVPPLEAGRDPLATLRLWKPSDERVARRN